MLPFRSVLEVLKYAEPEDSLLEFSTVSARWAQATQCEELWIEMIGAFGFSHRRNEDEHWAQAFRREYYMFRKKLVIFCTKHYWVFNCCEETWKKVHHGRRIRTPGCSVLLPDESVFFYCGGHTQQANVWRVSRAGSLTLPDPAVTRFSPGCIYYKRQVFLFGGQSFQLMTSTKNKMNFLKASEVFALTTSRWTTLPDMQSARGCFTVALHKNLMYLCGGMTLDSETFDPERRIFRSLDLKLARSLQASAVFIGEDLIVFAYGEAVRGSLPDLKMRKDYQLQRLLYNFESVCVLENHLYGVDHCIVFKKHWNIDELPRRLPPSS